MAQNTDDSTRIQPCASRPHYWAYKGQPVLLLGGTVEDNLFQIPDLAEHLDLLTSVGGNYVRCTMSSRDEGDVWPWAKDDATGLYDLATWDPEYWARFERLLALAFERDVIVQIEIWATWDCYVRLAGWENHPLNPTNNVNYSAEQSGLDEVVDYPPPTKIQPLFETVPELSDLPVVRKFQEAFVDRLLDASLAYGNVLYCMDNETNADPRWGLYWANYVRGKAQQAGRHIEITEMWDNWDPSDGEVPGAKMQDIENHPFLHRSNVKCTLDRPDIYTFVDISNHNTQHGQTHWETGQWTRDRIVASGAPRPLNCVKTYGCDGSAKFAGSTRDGQERFWRNIFGGLASCRFHRPPSGLGLSDLAQSHLRSMRMLTDAMDVFTCEPHLELLADRDANEAYCFARPGAEYAVCFMNGGSVTLDCSAIEGEVTLRWLDVMQSAWMPEQTAQAGPVLTLTAPGEGFWAVLIRRT
jgi:hypothetical protein